MGQGGLDPEGVETRLMIEHVGPAVFYDAAFSAVPGGLGRVEVVQAPTFGLEVA